jgi:type II secretion system protein L
MGKKIVGIDIQDSAVAAVLVDSTLKGTRLMDHALIQLTGPADQDDHLARALEQLTRKMDLSGAMCIAAFPADRVSFRNLQVPFKKTNKIRQVLPFELEPTVPFAVDDVVIDFQTIASDSVSENTDLVAAAVRKDQLAPFLKTLAEFNLEPEIVTISGYMAALCLANLSEIPDQTLFVDIDDRKTTVVAVRSGKVSMVRTLPTGAAGDSDGDRMCNQIRQTLLAYQDSQKDDFQPQKVFLTGSVNGYVNKIGQTLSIPTQRADIVSQSPVKLSTETVLTWKPERMDHALALALMDVSGFKAMNFRKGPFAVRKRWLEHKERIVRTGILAGLVLLVLLTNVFINYFATSRQVTAVETQIEDIFRATFPEVQRVVEPLQQMRQKIEEARKTSLSAGIDSNQPPMVDILNEISRRIPKPVDVEFNRMVIGDGNVLIAGTTSAFNFVDDIKSALESSELFTSVTIVSTNKDKQGDRIRFRLKVRTQDEQEVPANGA